MVGLWAIYGLFVSPEKWRRSIILSLLLMLLLPLSEQLDVYLGFPLRVWTTQFVEALFSGLRQDLTAQNILRFEGRLTKIDLPCSGIRSLWSAAVLVLGLTWIRGASIDFKWLGLGLGYFVLLIATNIVRIIILVEVGLVLNFPDIADKVHLPLGMMGFIVSSLFYVWIFESMDSRPINERQRVDFWPRPFQFKLLVACVCVLLLSISTQKKFQATVATVHISPAWPKDLSLQTIPLSPIEKQFYSSSNAWLAQKHRFDLPIGSGSVVWIGADSWRSHHNPIRCYQSSGLKIISENPIQIFGAHYARLLKFDDSSLKAVFWFQSKTLSTDDFSARIWNDFMGQQQQWLLVSILFDSEHSDVLAVVRRFHEQADLILNDYQILD